MKIDKMSDESIDNQRINSKYFYDIAYEIKSDLDYIPFKDLLIKIFNCRYLKFKEYIEFNVNLADCEILYFKDMAYSNLGFISGKMDGDSEFCEYYFNAIKNKNDNGNFLHEDFDRISEYEQFERDLY